MPRSRFDNSDSSFTASRVFAGRHDERRIFDDAWAGLSASSLSVVVFFGIAGIGKTRLGQALHFRLEAARRRNDAVAKLDFRIAELGYPPDALASLARQLSYACPTFEFAALRRWALLGQPLAEFGESFPLRSDSPTTGILEYFRQAGSSLAEDGGLIPGLPLLITLARSGSRQLQQWTNENKAVLSDINRFDAFDIQERLPYYLGLDIARAAKRGHRTILLLDALERLTDKSGDYWVRDLLAPAQGCLAVVGSRHKIRWDADDSSWGEHISQHRVGKLSDLDVDDFLRSVPINNREIRKRIVSVCNGYPLAMDHCVSIYEQSCCANRSPSPDDFGHDPDELVARLIDHLSEVEREVVTILALAGPVNRELYASLVDTCLRGAIAPSFRILKRRAYIEEAGDGYLAVDAPLASHLAKLSSPSLRRKVVRLVQSAYERVLASSDKPSDWSKALQQQMSHSGDSDVFSAPNALRIARWLFDHGRFHEVEAAIGGQEPRRPVARSVWNLLRGIVARRIGRLQSAGENYRNVDPKLLGSWAEYARFHITNHLRLSGNYKSAYRRYRHLVYQSNGSDEELTREATRQLADLHMLRGEFGKAREVLTSLLSFQLDDLERAKVQRILGHVYRWNLQMQEARHLYAQARELAIRSGALGLRLQLATNLVEANVLGGFPVDDDIWTDCVIGNDKAGTLLEFGKALTTEALAMIVRGAADEAIEEKLLHANEVQASVGYKSGHVFVEYVRVWLASCSADSGAIADALRTLSSRIADVGVYSFLLSLPWKAPLPPEAERTNPDWLAPSRLSQHFDQILQRVSIARRQRG